MLTFGPKRAHGPRLGLWGCGRIGQQVVDGLLGSLAPAATVVGVLARTRSERLLQTAERLRAEPCTTIDDLLALRPEVVLEVASAAGLAEHGTKVLEAGVDLIAASPACLNDPKVEARFRRAAEASGRRVLMPAASADGVDWLLANKRELRSVRLTLRWQASEGDVPYTGGGEPQEIFRGTAREAGGRFPRQVNFVVMVGLSGLGLDTTEVRVLLDPQVSFTSYLLEAEAYASALRAEVELRRPDGLHSRLTALSALATLRDY